MKKHYFLVTAFVVLSMVSQTNAQVNNTFLGLGAGTSNTGNFNTGFGLNALYYNSSNSNNAFGLGALSMASGGFNCAFGNEALTINTSGSLNCAFGTRSLISNTTGSGNIAIGHRTMEMNSAGGNNTAVGYAAIPFSKGEGNIAIGSNTGRNLTGGSYNVFLGLESGKNLITGYSNLFLGKVTLETAPSTLRLAGNNTSNTIIIADGGGMQRIFVNKNGNTGIGLGNNVIPANRLDVSGGVVIGRGYVPNVTSTEESPVLAPLNGMLVEGKVGIGNKSPNNKLEITHGTNGNSGLRLTNLTSQYNPTAAQVSNKFLTVNANGDVVLQKMAGLVSSNLLASNANTMTTNVNNIPASAPIVNSISNTINTNNQLITTVNGVASAPINLPQALLTEVDGSITNELQTLSQNGNTITLSNGGGSFTLPTFVDTNTDAQSLALNGNVLSISNGNSVTLPTQTFQTLSQAGNTVTLSNGGGSFTLPSQTFQTVSQAGNTITLSNGGGSFTLPTTSVTAGTNVTVTGNGSTATPYVVSSADTSLYANNGVINQATTTSGNRVVDMNNRNIWFNTANSNSNGKIYLGSSTSYPNTTGSYRLFVEGGILTEKVKVALRNSANWADYVFADDYKLMPLKEVEKFVAANKHLPGIDSAETLAQNGLDIAEMQAKHMEKIEELTLYIIDQDKKLEAQAKSIENNTKEIETLKAQIQALIAKTK